MGEFFGPSIVVIPCSLFCRKSITNIPGNSIFVDFSYWELHAGALLESIKFNAVARGWMDSIFDWMQDSFSVSVNYLFIFLMMRVFRGILMGLIPKHICLHSCGRGKAWEGS